MLKDNTVKKIDDVLNLPEVLILTGFARSTLYLYMDTQNFPLPKKMGLRKVYWSKTDILKWFKEKGFTI